MITILFRALASLAMFIIFIVLLPIALLSDVYNFITRKLK